tara:strand:+ start:131 stop:475 length:345 start_codon:yes stop_codon:yes gene_type:complete
MKIYHNPRCRKSRETLSIIQSHHYECEIIEYLKNPISKSELKNLINMLNISAFDLLRKEEKLFKKKYKHQNLTEEDCLDLLYMHPILIQRPIVVKDNSAILGRPPINVLDLFNK